MRQHETLCFPRDRLLTSWYRLTCQCPFAYSKANCPYRFWRPSSIACAYRKSDPGWHRRSNAVALPG